MDSHTLETPQRLIKCRDENKRKCKCKYRYRVGYYEVDLITFEVRKVTYSFNKLDKQSKLKVVNKWLGDINGSSNT